MAKNPGNGRLRVLCLEFEGDNETIQEGLRTLGNAVARTFTQPAATRYLPTKQTTVEEVPQVAESQCEEEDSDEVAVRSPASPRARERSSGRPKKFPIMNLVKDLDLHPKGHKSYREFHAEKMPKSQPAQIAVALYYLQRVLERNGITAEHVYTCFDAVGFKSPNDLPNAIRQCASRKGWVDASDSKSLTLTQPGINYVVHDLPNKKAD